MSQLRTIPEARPLPPAPLAEAPGPLADASAAALLRTLGSSHPDTASHSAVVAELSVGVAEKIGATAERLQEIRLTALLHDVGKLGVPLDVLEKEEPLTDAEVEQMQRHTEIGERMVRTMPGLWELGPAIRACHERWDGQGYPDGLQGEEIPLASRIVFVCDAYDAMTSNRNYGAATPPEIALHEIVVQAGVQFCPRSAEALVDLLSGPFRLLGARRRSAISPRNVA